MTVDEKQKLLVIAEKMGLARADLDRAIIFARFTLDKTSFDAEPVTQAIVQQVEATLPSAGAPWSALEKLVLLVISSLLGSKKEACYVVHFAGRRTVDSAQSIMKRRMLSLFFRLFFWMRI